MMNAHVTISRTRREMPPALAYETADELLASCLDLLSLLKGEISGSAQRNGIIADAERVIARVEGCTHA